MEEFEFAFVSGTYMQIAVGEDGYTVNILDNEPLMGTFTDFEELLYGIAPIVQNNSSSNAELIQFAQELTLALSNTLTIDEIEEILLK